MLLKMLQKQYLLINNNYTKITFLDDKNNGKIKTYVGKIP